MYEITFRLASVDGNLPPARVASKITHLCDALVATNIEILLQDPSVPLLLHSGVRYCPEPPDREWFDDIYTVLRNGCGDCEDLACWRCAELIVRFGVPAEPLVTWERLPDRMLFHVRTETWQGIEDPSRALGMV